jgi:hypothetical protein
MTVCAATRPQVVAVAISDSRLGIVTGRGGGRLVRVCQTNADRKKSQETQSNGTKSTFSNEDEKREELSKVEVRL